MVLAPCLKRTFVNHFRNPSITLFSRIKIDDIFSDPSGSHPERVFMFWLAHLLILSSFRFKTKILFLLMIIQHVFVGIDFHVYKIIFVLQYLTSLFWQISFFLLYICQSLYHVNKLYEIFHNFSSLIIHCTFWRAFS